MTEGIYGKEGESVALTRVGGTTGLAHVIERGIAGMRGGRFFSASADAEAGVEGAGGDPLLDLARQIDDAVGSAARVERLHLISGTTRHTLQIEGGEPDRAWSETHARGHVELAAGGLRLALDRGGASLDAIRPGELAAIADALARSEAWPPEAGHGAVTLSAPVVAGLVARLADAADRLPASVPLAQAAPDAFRLDGRGEPVVGFAPAGKQRSSWPNVYRPSYRAPAVPAIVHAILHVESGTAESGGTRALALLARPRVGEDEVRFEALAERDGRYGAVEVAIRLDRIPELVRTGKEATWFPFGAGAWGFDAVADHVIVMSNFRDD